jgi:translation initiation factor IF-2
VSPHWAGKGQGDLPSGLRGPQERAGGRCRPAGRGQGGQGRAAAGARRAAAGSLSPARAPPVRRGPWSAPPERARRAVAARPPHLPSPAADLAHELGLRKPGDGPRRSADGPAAGATAAAAAAAGGPGPLGAPAAGAKGAAGGRDGGGDAGAAPTPASNGAPGPARSSLAAGPASRNGARNPPASAQPDEQHASGPALMPGAAGRLSPLRVSFTEGSGGGGGSGGGAKGSGGGGAKGSSGGGGGGGEPRFEHPSLIQTYDELGGTESPDSGTPKSQHSGALSLRTQSVQSR